MERSRCTPSSGRWSNWPSADAVVAASASAAASSAAVSAVRRRGRLLLLLQRGSVRYTCDADSTRSGIDLAFDSIADFLDRRLSWSCCRRVDSSRYRCDTDSTRSDTAVRRRFRALLVRRRRCDPSSSFPIDSKRCTSGSDSTRSCIATVEVVCGPSWRQAIGSNRYTCGTDSMRLDTTSSC